MRSLLFSFVAFVAFVAFGLLLAPTVTLAQAPARGTERPRAPGGEWTVAYRSGRPLRWIRAEGDRIVAGGPGITLRSPAGGQGEWASGAEEPAPAAASPEEGPPCEQGTGRASVVRVSPALAYARCTGEVVWRREGSSPWARWSSLPDSGALLTAALPIDADRALFALADGRVYVLYGIRLRRDREGDPVLAFARLGDQVYALTARAILRRALPPPPSSHCQVQLLSVLSAEQYRGSPPPSPATAAARRSREWESEEFGSSHVQCRYRVRVRGRTYSYLHAVDTTTERVRSAAAYCDSLRPSIPERIRSFTEQCVDLRAGEYYGYHLEPISP